jgi:hypothetical protein
MNHDLAHHKKRQRDQHSLDIEIRRNGTVAPALGLPFITPE